MEKEINKTCFVCRAAINEKNSKFNFEVHLPVCDKCQGTQKEKDTVRELLESLADGFVCGCI